MHTQNLRANGSAIAGILHRVYYYAPEQAYLNDVATLIEEWPRLNQSPEQYVQQISRAIDNDSLANIQQDYYQLFVGPGTKHAYPWGSVYTDKENLLFGESNIAFEQFCRRQGIEFNTQGNDPCDHIGLIFGVLSHLLQSDNKSAVTELFENHLLPWAKAFIDAVGRHALTGYYQGFGALTKIFLEDCQQLMHLTPQQLRLYK